MTRPNVADLRKVQGGERADPPKRQKLAWVTRHPSAPVAHLGNLDEYSIVAHPTRPVPRTWISDNADPELVIALGGVVLRGNVRGGTLS
ncbi:MAG: hypothetical protein Q9218_007790 [Villophora microphyllina]